MTARRFRIGKNHPVHRLLAEQSNEKARVSLIDELLELGYHAKVSPPALRGEEVRELLVALTDLRALPGKVDDLRDRLLSGSLTMPAVDASRAAAESTATPLPRADGVVDSVLAGVHGFQSAAH